MIRIDFESIRVDRLSRSSGLFAGTNILIGRTNMHRVNAGMGAVDGDRNIVDGGFHHLFDEDVLGNDK